MKYFILGGFFLFVIVSYFIKNGDDAIDSIKSITFSEKTDAVNSDNDDIALLKNNNTNVDKEVIKNNNQGYVDNKPLDNKDNGFSVEKDISLNTKTVSVDVNKNNNNNDNDNDNEKIRDKKSLESVKKLIYFEDHSVITPPDVNIESPVDYTIYKNVNYDDILSIVDYDAKVIIRRNISEYKNNILEKINGQFKEHREKTYKSFQSHHAAYLEEYKKINSAYDEGCQDETKNVNLCENLSRQIKSIEVKYKSILNDLNNYIVDVNNDELNMLERAKVQLDDIVGSIYEQYVQRESKGE